MTNHFEYKGYIGSAEVDVLGGMLVGKLLFIRDVIAYSAETLPALEGAFREAVEDYLKTCADLGDEPDTPCKGTFNVRVGPEIHRDVAMAARGKNMGLNEFVRDALVAAVHGPVQHVHKHELRVRMESAPAERIATSGQPTVWEEARATTH